jgi:hypothetical protein
MPWSFGIFGSMGFPRRREGFKATPVAQNPSQATHSLFPSTLKDPLDKRIFQAIFGLHHIRPPNTRALPISRHFKSMTCKTRPSPHPKNPEYENHHLFLFA